MSTTTSGSGDPAEDRDAEQIWATAGTGSGIPLPFPERARAVLTSWSGVLRADPGRSGMLAILVLGLAAVVLSFVFYLRGDAHRIAEPSDSTRGAQAESALPQPVLPTPSPVPSSARPSIVVDVEGKVARPGVQTMAAGSRVVDAIAAAGGTLAQADTTSLDLARPLVDGEQVRVDLPGRAPGPAAVDVPGGSGVPAGPVNLNTATVAELDVLPGVGPVTAQHILDWRNQHGRFTSVNQLNEVSGIGPAMYERLAPLVTV